MLGATSSGTPIPTKALLWSGCPEGLENQGRERLVDGGDAREVSHPEDDTRQEFFAL